MGMAYGHSEKKAHNSKVEDPIYNKKIECDT